MTVHRGFPAGPLLELLDARAAEAGITRRAFVRDRFGDAVDRNYWRWIVGQHVSVDVADRICVALGVHPTQLWSQWNETPPPRFRRAHA